MCLLRFKLKFERGNIMVYQALQALQLFLRLDLASKWPIAHVRYINFLTWLRGSLIIFYIWFGFLCAQVSFGNCETMEAWTICSFDTKASESYQNFNISNVGYWPCGISISVAPTACVPSCGPNAFCQENGGPVPVCVCNLGFHGDGFNCSGSCKVKPPFPYTLLSNSYCFTIFCSTKEYVTFIFLKNNNNSLKSRPKSGS